MKALLEKLFGPRVPCKCGKKMYPLRRNVPIFVCVCGALKVGKNTITLSPGGVDVIRWSGTQAPVAAGDLGMDVATGVASLFLSGTARNILTTLSLQQSLFSFTHISGSASTGALGFTPRFAIYTGIADDTTTFANGSGIITGTGTSARGAGAANTTGAFFFNGSAVIQIGANVLTVSVFGSGGITLLWSGSVSTHAGALLVVG